MVHGKQDFLAPRVKGPSASVQLIRLPASVKCISMVGVFIRVPIS
jgi:hypothetical protein